MSLQSSVNFASAQKTENLVPMWSRCRYIDSRVVIRVSDLTRLQNLLPPFLVVNTCPIALDLVSRKKNPVANSVNYATFQGSMVGYPRLW